MADNDYEYPIIHRGGEMHSYWFINLYRYLLYCGAGSVHDPNNEFETVTLTAATWGVYDLSQIEWIVPGKLYEVQGATEAYESDTGA